MDSVTAFWIILVFVRILDVPFFVVIQYLFAKEYTRRNRFRLRMAGFAGLIAFTSIGVNLMFEFLFPTYTASQIGSVIYALIQLFCLYLLYRESFRKIVILFILTYISTMIPYQILELIYNSIGLDWASDNTLMLWYMLEKSALYVAYSFALYHIYIKKVRTLVYAGRDMWVVVFLAYSVIVTIAMNALREDYVGTYSNNIEVMNIFLIAFSIVNDIVVMSVIYIYMQGKRDAHERAVVTTMWKQDRARYEVRSENIAALNIKSHDLKHFLTMLKNEGDKAAVSELIPELEKIVSQYDSDIHTGCEPLDVILSENAAFCASNGITLKCVADGSLLSGMNEPDIYSLFENILSNSIDYLKTVEDPSKRICSIYIREAKDMVIIHQENYIEDDAVKRERGEIKTTKQDRSSHGYGLKSIAAIAKRYGGSMTVKTDDNLFRLNILIMRPAADPAPSVSPAA